jgi:hypothetical protein
VLAAAKHWPGGHGRVARHLTRHWRGWLPLCSASSEPDFLGRSLRVKTSRSCKTCGLTNGASKPRQVPVWHAGWPIFVAAQLQVPVDSFVRQARVRLRAYKLFDIGMALLLRGTASITALTLACVQLLKLESRTVLDSANDPYWEAVRVPLNHVRAPSAHATEGWRTQSRVQRGNSIRRLGADTRLFEAVALPLRNVRRATA